MWLFLMSPLGRKVGLGVLIVIALFILVKVHDSKIYHDGQVEGARTTILSTEKQLQASWKKADDTVALKQKELDETAANLQKTQDALEVARTQITNKIKEDEVNLKTKLEVTIPHDVKQMAPEAVNAELDKLAPTPQDVLIALQQNEALKEQVSITSDRVSALIAASYQNDQAYARAISVANERTDAVKEELATMTQERDFYLNASHSLTKKKCGIFKKILTLGMACKG